MKYALISVYDKKGVIELAQKLLNAGYGIISTGGTYTLLSETFGTFKIFSVASITHFPEILDGRVKTLHPMIHGSILADRANPEHLRQMEQHGLCNIDVVVVNLYPFWNVSESSGIQDAIELIDIGGVTLIRAAAKNFEHVTVLTDFSQYDTVLETSPSERRRLAGKAFELTSDYDALIARYFNGDEPRSEKRDYHLVSSLKYGCNPHQQPAGVYAFSDDAPGLRLLNGEWGYINVLDAANAWGLATELSLLFSAPAATSFKHTNPSGAAVAIDWSEIPRESQTLLNKLYSINNRTPPSVNAYARARNADPQSSFGDFIGYSGIVDDALAEFISAQISDGIVAAGYTEGALEMLRKKKKGSFIVIEAQLKRRKPTGYMEMRDLPGFNGLALGQFANERVVTRDDLTRNVPTAIKTIPEASIRDLLIANACMKYAQSNNVACATQSQLIGLAAGQQSRVGAVELVAGKVSCWINRHSQEIIDMFSNISGTRQERIMATTHHASTMIGRQSAPSDISLASDGFFPFADNIAEAAKIPVKFISQPGGSIQDATIVEACDTCGIAMSMTGVRVFTH